jgi:protein-tyrosine phosphatase
MAEGLLANALSILKINDCQICSAGLGALIGHPPDPMASQLMLKNGLDISGHRARQVSKEMIRKADLILVMESAHKRAIEESEPSAKGKVFRLGEWGKFDIADPYKKDLTAFVEAFELIEQGITQWLQKLK